jgi:hypothetical protein
VRLSGFSTLSYGLHTSSLLRTHGIIRLLRKEGVALWQFMMQLLVASTIFIVKL